MKVKIIILVATLYLAYTFGQDPDEADIDEG
jgi:hypothetical protein